MASLFYIKDSFSKDEIYVMGCHKKWDGQNVDMRVTGHFKDGRRAVNLKMLTSKCTVKNKKRIPPYMIEGEVEVDASKPILIYSAEEIREIINQKFKNLNDDLKDQASKTFLPKTKNLQTQIDDLKKQIEDLKSQKSNLKKKE